MTVSSVVKFPEVKLTAARLVPFEKRILLDKAVLEPFKAARRYDAIETCDMGEVMRGLVLWLVGIPIPVIILLYVFKAM